LILRNNPERGMGIIVLFVENRDEPCVLIDEFMQGRENYGHAAS
jgi:hypothetical protein